MSDKKRKRLHRAVRTQAESYSLETTEELMEAILDFICLYVYEFEAYWIPVDESLGLDYLTPEVKEFVSKHFWRSREWINDELERAIDFSGQKMHVRIQRRSKSNVLFIRFIPDTLSCTSENDQNTKRRTRSSPSSSSSSSSSSSFCYYIFVKTECTTNNKIIFFDIKTCFLIRKNIECVSWPLFLCIP